MDAPKLHTDGIYGGYDNARRLDKMYADWSAADNRAAEIDYDNDALNEAAAALYDAYQQELFEAKKNAPRLVAVGGKYGVLEYWHADDRSRYTGGLEWDEEPFLAGNPRNGY